MLKRPSFGMIVLVSHKSGASSRTMTGAHRSLVLSQACAAYLGCTPTGDNGDNYNACTYLDPQSVSVSIIKVNGQAGPDYGCEAIAFPWAPSGVSGDPFSAIQGDCVLTPVEGIENSGDCQSRCFSHCFTERVTQRWC